MQARVTEARLQAFPAEVQERIAGSKETACRCAYCGRVYLPSSRQTLGYWDSGIHGAGWH